MGPPSAPGAAGGQLDRPPPSPEVPAGSPGSPQPLMSGPEGAEGQDGVDQLVKMVAGLDNFLLELARSLPAGAEDFNMARENIKRGAAKSLAAIGQTPATGPAAAGSQFPGGGFSGPG